MPFAAVIGAALGTVVSTLFIYLPFSIQDEGLLNEVFAEYIIPVLLASIFGKLYVFIVYAVSPQSKEIAVVVMTTVLCVVGILFIVTGWIFASEDTSLAFRATLQILTAIIVAVLAARSYRK